jgi:hypothetical protein
MCSSRDAPTGHVPLVASATDFTSVHISTTTHVAVRVVADALLDNFVLRRSSPHHWTLWTSSAGLDAQVLMPSSLSY